MFNKKVFLESFYFNKNNDSKEKTIEVELSFLKKIKSRDRFKYSFNQKQTDILLSTPLSFFTEKHNGKDINLGTLLLNVSSFLANFDNSPQIISLEFYCLDSETGDLIDFEIKKVIENNEIVLISKNEKGFIDIKAALTHDFILESEGYIPLKINVNGMKDGFFIFNMDKDGSKV